MHTKDGDVNTAMLPFFSITFTIQLISSFFYNIKLPLLLLNSPFPVRHPLGCLSLFLFTATHWLNRLDGNTYEQTMNDVLWSQGATDEELSTTTQRNK